MTSFRTSRSDAVRCDGGADVLKPRTQDRTTVVRTAKHKTTADRTRQNPNWRIIMDVSTLPAPPRSATPAARRVTVMRGSLLALDLGTSTGWALRTADDYTSSGTVLLKHTRYDGWKISIRTEGRSRRSTSKRSGVMPVPMPPTSTAVCLQSYRLGAKSISSPTRAFRWARSSASPPARAMPTRPQ